MFKPDKYECVFVNTSKDDFDLFEEFLVKERNKIMKDLPEDEPKTDELVIFVENLNDVLLSFGKEKLGVDLTNKLVSIDNIHVYSSDKFLEVSRKLSAYMNNNRGFVMPSHSLIFLNDDSYSFYSALTHEVVHSMDYKLVHLENFGDGYFGFRWLKTNGYCVTDTDFIDRDRYPKFNLLNEAMADLIGIDVSANYWDNNPILKNHFFSASGYTREVNHLLNVMITMGLRSDDDFETILRDFEKGFFMNPQLGLQRITNIYGDKDSFYSLDICEDKYLLRSSYNVDRALQNVKLFGEHPFIYVH